MSVYTVHAPPPRRGEPDSDPARFVFVRDGFSFWAFLFAPLWMLSHRLWLALLGYLVVMAGAQVVLMVLGAAQGIRVAVAFLLALLVGFEAPSLRRWTFGRRRWQSLGVVVADDLEAAERRFFDAWVADGRRPSPALISPPSGRAAGAAPPDVVGLFPQPGAWR
jgi:Protein of unknown function (DUF2628)